MDALPTELLLQILEYFDGISVGRFRRLSKRFYEVIMSNQKRLKAPIEILTFNALERHDSPEKRNVVVIVTAKAHITIELDEHPRLIHAYRNLPAHRFFERFQREQELSREKEPLNRRKPELFRGVKSTSFNFEMIAFFEYLMRPSKYIEKMHIEDEVRPLLAKVIVSIIDNTPIIVREITGREGTKANERFRLAVATVNSRIS